MTLHDFLEYLDRYRATRELGAQLHAMFQPELALIPIPVERGRDN
jgi:hypothetical protein